jgi:tripartite-type tricarboxylate transporter receptor subunit TctC
MGGLNVGEAMPHGDRLRILVQGGARRSRFAPGVPTFREAGVPIEMSSERGLIINRGVDSGVAKQIMAATAAVARNPEFVSAIEAQFTELDFLEAGGAGERLRGAETRFKSLWAGRRWMTAQ